MDSKSLEIIIKHWTDKNQITAKKNRIKVDLPFDIEETCRELDEEFARLDKEIESCYEKLLQYVPH